MLNANVDVFSSSFVWQRNSLCLVVVDASLMMLILCLSSARETRFLKPLRVLSRRSRALLKSESSLVQVSIPLLFRRERRVY
jgi:hypothetical protein